MAISEKRSIIIVGVGSSMSRSLALLLAGLGWNIALVSRTEKSVSAIASEVVAAQRNKNAKVVSRTADAGQAASLTAALDWSVQQFGGKVDVLNYNAAHVAPSDILTLTPEDLEADFRVSALGTLIAGQWFVEHAQLDRVSQGEFPLFLVTGGILDKEPHFSVSSLCVAKAASQTVSRLFAQVLPDRQNILVGMPLVSASITNLETGKYNPGFEPDDIIQKLFKPFFEERENRDSTSEWIVERVL